jgi:hypothetical protein
MQMLDDNGDAPFAIGSRLMLFAAKLWDFGQER